MIGPFTHALRDIDPSAAKPEVVVLAPEGREVGRLLWFPRFLDASLATAVQEAFQIPWEQAYFPRFRCHEPRLTAWFCDLARTYTYSGVTRRAAPWPPALLELRALLDRVAAFHFGPGARFTSCLANRYEDGGHHISPHRDNEPEFVPGAPIASLTFGASRPFTLRHHPAGGKRPGEHRVTFELGHGSLLIMAGTTQDHYKHGIPKSRSPVAPRINLTYRHHDLLTAGERASSSSASRIPRT